MTIPLKYNIRSLLQRRSRTVLTVLGIGSVISIFVAMVAFAAGMAASFKNTGSPDNIVVLQKSAFSQSLSSLPKSSKEVIPHLPYIKRKGDQVLVSPELSVEPWVGVAGGKQDVFMVARGVEPIFFDVVDTIRVVQGSSAMRGNKVLLGRAAQHKLGGIGPGSSIVMYAEKWTVSGIFEAGGSSLEFTILADLSDLMRAGNRDELTCYTLKAESASSVDRLIKLLEADRRILVTARSEPDYYAGSGMMFAVVARLGLIIALIVAIGAVFGGMNTMYTAVAGRMREIATLRALGFGKRSVLFSIILESTLLALAGGLVGIAAGSLVDGARISVLTANIRFTVSTPVVLSALLLSLVVGFLGGILPARHAARLEIVEGMRQL